MSTEALNDRRQRAVESFQDEMTGRTDMFGTTTRDERLVAARDAAIETATRVQITPEALAAGREAWARTDGDWSLDPGPRETARLAASLRALGFEVEP